MISRFFFILLIVGLASSCVPKKKIYYLQDLPRDGVEIDTEFDYNTTLKADDLLRVVVTSSNMEAVQDFNKLISPSMQNDLVIGGQQQLFGYLVDEEGKIDFPVLGQINVAGKSIVEVSTLLREEISEYVSDSVFVDVRLLNYKVTVLGEVNSPGTYQLQTNRATVLQVLGLAGDLSIYGSRNDITLLREAEGKRASYTIDITSKTFLDSEFYYLQQNDIIIVNPNNAQVQSAGFNRNAPLFVSIASLLLSIIVIISRN